eukprot:m.265344 g.265344  ORF g.265344 m.265344 type:complete len:333 (+) comp61384_c0_seq1:338-1336(+)
MHIYTQVRTMAPFKFMCIRPRCAMVNCMLLFMTQCGTAMSRSDMNNSNPTTMTNGMISPSCGPELLPRYINFITTGKTGTKMTMEMIHKAYAANQSHVKINYPTHWQPTLKTINKLKQSWKSEEGKFKFWPVIHLMRDPIDVALSLLSTPQSWLEHLLVNYQFSDSIFKKKLDVLKAHGNSVLVNSDFVELRNHMNGWERVHFPVLKIQVKFDAINDTDVRNLIKTHLCLVEDYVMPSKDHNTVLPFSKSTEALAEKQKLLEKLAHKGVHHKPVMPLNNMHHGATREQLLSALPPAQARALLNTYKQASLDYANYPRIRIVYPSDNDHDATL